MTLKVLVTGANGQLGQALQYISGQSPTAYIFADRQQLDISNQAAINDFLDQHKIDYLVNAAAYTAVDHARDEFELACAINASAPAYLAQACADRNIRFIHISTDYVFAGDKKTPYTETDATGPINSYGLTKLQGEQQVLAANPQAMVLRTSWVFSQWRNNFLLTMLKLAQENELRLINDQIGGPSWALHIAELIDKIILLAKTEHINGIYHFCGYPYTSWYGFAQEIFDQAKNTGLIQSSPKLIPITSKQWDSPEPRPLNSRLYNSKITDYFYRANASLERPERTFRPLDLPFKRDWRDGISHILKYMASHQ